MRVMPPKEARVFSHAFFRMAFYFGPENLNESGNHKTRRKFLPPIFSWIPGLQTDSYFMIAEKDSIESNSADSLPNSRKVYVNGKLHADVRVPFREISQANTKSFDGTVEPNEPIRVYDTSGPWSDPNFSGDSSIGIPALRAEWIRQRGDTAEYEGRDVKPEDNGYLTRGHEEYASSAERTKNRLEHFRGEKRKPLRASAGHAVTQLYYARQGNHHAGDGIHRDPREPAPCSGGL